MTDTSTVLMQQLHDEHAAALWGYCLSLTGRDHARAEDVVQETMIRAWGNRARLDESHGHRAKDGLRHLCAVIYDHRPSDARHRAVACGHQPSDARCLPRDAHGHHDGHGT